MPNTAVIPQVQNSPTTNSADKNVIAFPSAVPLDINGLITGGQAGWSYVEKGDYLYFVDPDGVARFGLFNLETVGLALSG